MKIAFSLHAEIEIQKRRIEKKHVLKVTRNPQQKLKKGEIWVCQSKYFDKLLKKEMLLRVFAEEDIKGLKVITAYKTSKIRKYWVKK
ncbi:MAG: hypothetical protein HYW26_00535 [Candidatus Aenigmarchaeota archaeon]|nr:hypothetical protein [Candidatus Aenigmarchaeota archaeon]